MKRLLLILALSLSLGLAPLKDANADYSLTYPFGSQTLVWLLSGGRLAFIFFDWEGDADGFTSHTFTNASPAFADLGGGPVIGYFLNYLYTSGGRLYYDVYGQTGGGWFYIGIYFI